VVRSDEIKYKMKKVIKYYFIMSSFVMHLLVLVLLVKVVGSFASLVSFLGDVLDRL